MNQDIAFKNIGKFIVGVALIVVFLMPFIVGLRELGVDKLPAIIISVAAFWAARLYWFLDGKIKGLD